MTDEQLLEWTRQISADQFGREFKDHISFNKRLRTTGGRYLPGKRKIEINPSYLDEWGKDEVEGIIKHELCHYHLHIEGKGYNHRDKEFRQLLKETNSPRHCTPLPSAKRRPMHEYKCETCGYLYKRQRRVDVKKYRCGRCKGILKKLKESY
ncbi:SprT family protein [Salimicrobium halophilum]|uniref:SprT-like protein n=1 Tax=Salimicrobium halophilum TaxID=86666 RepID=A0A1G8VQX2_9BACI|nr:SprT family protein [Salimicrobium halophilum]SDJ67795.1 SprT-like protein [Salimicrobium halophilum]